MIRTFILWVFGLLCFGTVGCQDLEKQSMCVIDKNDYQLIEVDAKSRNITILENIISDLDFIQLETLNECLIGKIENIELYNDKIFVLDNVCDAIFIFDINGKFLNSINKKGKGPGEYSTINNFRIYNNQIIIADNDYLKILFYSINGTFIKEKKVDFNFTDFFSTKDYYYFFNDNAPQLKKEYKSKLLCFDKDFKFISGQFEYDNHDEFRRSNFYYLNDSLYFTHSVDDYFYVITGDTLTPRYKFDFGENNYDKNNPLKYDMLLTEEFNNKKFAIYPRAFLNSGNCLFFNYLCGKNNRQVYFNKERKVCDVIYKVKNVNLLFLIIPPKAVYKSRFVNYLDPAKLYDERFGSAKINNTILSEQFNRLKSKVSITDNPIIVLYSINSDANWYD